ncbi:MAG: hypothetical protein WC343_02570 [Bacilli bacterium]|jgi:hypothetical protein
MKKVIINIIIAFLLIIFGIAVTVSETLDFTTSNTLDGTTFSKKELIYDVELNETLTTINTSFSHDPTIVYDDSILSGSMKIVISYYDDFVVLNKYSLNNDSELLINIDATQINKWDIMKDFVNMTIDGLKEKRIINYSSALKPDVTIYINQVDKNIVKISE